MAIIQRRLIFKHCNGASVVQVSQVVHFYHNMMIISMDMTFFSFQREDADGGNDGMMEVTGVLHCS